MTIPPEERDANLTESLEAEWPGILQWVLDGCLEWQRIGLKPPKVVTDATCDYLENEDILTEWITECCLQGANYQTKSSLLFASWSMFAEASGEQKGSNKRLSQKLVARGFAKKKTGNGQYFYGLTLRQQVA